MNKKGFTLVELLAVIVILGLVITIVGTKGFGAFDNTKKAITRQNINAIKEASRVLATQIENCDDELDNELWTTSDLTDFNSIPAEKKNCSGLKEKMSSNECIKITVKYLIDNDYLSDNKDFESLKNNSVSICKDDNKIVINTDEIENDDNTKDAKKNLILADVIIENAKNNNDTTRTKYQENPLTTPAQQISAKEEKTLSIAPDGSGTSYYFRGNVIDNYVDFAGMCWRVVRIAGDKSVKLILEDQDNTCATSDGNWNIPTTTGGTINTGNFGYTEYAANTLTAPNGATNANYKIIMDYLNGNTRKINSMATAFKNFQTGPLANYLDKLKAGDWCLDDRAYPSEYIITTPLTPDEVLQKQVYEYSFYYDSYVRLVGISAKESTFNCNGTKMGKFGDKSTNMYVGTLTADEVAYAGGNTFTDNDTYYLINNYSTSKHKNWRTLSPSKFEDPGNSYSVSSFCVADFGNIYSCPISAEMNALRPAVSLIKNIEITNGDGTKTNAYKIID